MTARTTLETGHFFRPVMKEDEDEGLSVCLSVCWGGENAATVCWHSGFVAPSQQQLISSASVSYCNCLLAHNGGLSVLRQMLLVCLVNMVAKKRTSPSVPCVAFTATADSNRRERASNLPESNLNAFRSQCLCILDKVYESHHTVALCGN